MIKGKDRAGTPILAPASSGQGSSEEIRFNALQNDGFDNVASIAQNTANTAIQGRYPIPQRCKILKVVANYSAITDATPAINIVVGNGGEGAVGSTDTLATGGALVFSADQALTAAADTPLVLIPSNYDVIYDTGTLLTLRAVTGGGKTITNLKVTFLMAVIDTKATVSTANPNTDF